MLRLSLDTDVVISQRGIDLAKRRVYRGLKKLHKAGIIELAMSSRYWQDTLTDRTHTRRRRNLRARKLLTTTGSVFRIGVSRLSSGDSLVRQQLMDELYRIFKIDPKEFPLQSRTKRHTLWDLDHLYAHKIAERHYFLTYDTGTISRASELAALDIHVRDPRVVWAAIEVAQAHGTVSPADLATRVCAELGPG